jgi:hypothetical protein
VVVVPADQEVLAAYNQVEVVEGEAKMQAKRVDRAILHQLVLRREIPVVLHHLDLGDQLAAAVEPVQQVLMESKLLVLQEVVQEVQVYQRPFVLLEHQLHMLEVVVVVSMCQVLYQYLVVELEEVVQVVLMILVGEIQALKILVAELVVMNGITLVVEQQEEVELWL